MGESESATRRLRSSVTVLHSGRSPGIRSVTHADPLRELSRIRIL